MKKGQEAVAALIGMSVIFFIFFVVLYSISAPREERSIQSIKYYNAESVCEQLQLSIDSAASSGPGFGSGIELPRTLNGIEYSMNVYPNRIYITWEGGSYICSYYADNVYLLVNRSSQNVRIAYLQKEKCLTDELKKFNTTIYCNRYYDDLVVCPVQNPPCENDTYREIWTQDKFFADLPNYDFLFLEDTHFDNNMLTTMQNALQAKRYAVFLSEHIKDYSWWWPQGSDGPTFGFDYHWRLFNDANKKVTIVKTDPLVSFILGEQFIPYEYPYVSGNIVALGNYSDNKIGLGRKDYGQSFIYYYSDFDDKLNPAVFQSKLIKNVNLTAQYIANYLTNTFNITNYTLYIQNVDNAIYIDQTGGAG